MRPVRESLIAELELAVKAGSPESRITTLRRVTDLFLNDADRLNDEQIKVFDDVLYHLTSKIEISALAELGTRLAPVDNAPVETIRRLARNDKIMVARPVLAESKRLNAQDLIEIAKTKSQAHLLVIAGRDKLEESVTDVLLVRGDREVFVELASNARARFSDAGYQALVDKAESDDSLTETLGRRLDIPLRFLRDLLQRASDVVRLKILSLAPAETQDQIRRVIADMATAVVGTAVLGTAVMGPAVMGPATVELDYTQAEKRVQSIHKRGSLDEAALMEFVRQDKFAEVTVGLARLSGMPLKTIAKLMTGMRNDLLLAPCKVAGLSWHSVEVILRNRRRDHKISDRIMDLARTDYIRLTFANAQKALQVVPPNEKAK
ncbi:MAG TPA: DUF2336 domain-containing protein [Xanthobacteraceae bacterium]